MSYKNYGGLMWTRGVMPYEAHIIGPVPCKLTHKEEFTQGKGKGKGKGKECWLWFVRQKRNVKLQSQCTLVDLCNSCFLLSLQYLFHNTTKLNSFVNTAFASCLAQPSSCCSIIQMIGWTMDFPTSSIK